MKLTGAAILVSRDIEVYRRPRQLSRAVGSSEQFHTREGFPMPVAPYENTFREDGELCFLAEVPALAHIGGRFDELSESSFCYVAPDQEQQRWRQLAGRLEQLL